MFAVSIIRADGRETFADHSVLFVLASSDPEFEIAFDGILIQSLGWPALSAEWDDLCSNFRFPFGAELNGSQDFVASPAGSS